MDDKIDGNMRVLQVIPSLFSGGAERFVVDLCNQLTSRHDVLLVLFFPPKEGQQHFVKDLCDNVEVRYLNKRRGLDFGMFRKLDSLIKDFRPDIVHTHVRAFNYVAPLAFLRSFHLVHTVHNDAFKEAGNPRELAFRRFFYKRGVVFPVTISKESAESFNRAYPGIEHSMIYNGRVDPVYVKGIDVKKEVCSYKLTPTTKVFTFLGRITEQKNVMMLLDSFNNLCDSGADAILLLIGRAGTAVEMKELKSRIQDKKRIIYLGEKLNATDYLKESDFFCLASKYEGMPISLIEAFAVGCVRVCTAVGGIPEMVGENGFLSKEVAKEAYSKALLDAYNSEKEVYEKFRQSIRKEFVEKYEIRGCTESYERVYSLIVNNEKIDSL